MPGQHRRIRHGKPGHSDQHESRHRNRKESHDEHPFVKHPITSSTEDDPDL
jgi:hypothetical protein